MPDSEPSHQTRDETTQVLAQLARIGLAIDKELTLISERMTWLVISESFIFSAFTLAVANHEKTVVLVALAYLMSLVGTLLAVLVYPALLAAHSAATRLKGERDRFEFKMPEALRVNLLASGREHFWGSVPAFAIPVMLILAWSVILIVLFLAPLR
jgi:hypothetical protein